MDALILSCGTGGGHNSAGEAIEQSLFARGHRVTKLNPYLLKKWINFQQHMVCGVQSSIPLGKRLSETADFLAGLRTEQTDGAAIGAVFNGKSF